jgi:hypothetical protein
VDARAISGGRADATVLAMALTMRPTTNRDRSPATADLDHWIVIDDGIPIGRIYKRHAPANADVAWFWSITAYVEPRSELRTNGMAETLDAAKAAFRDSYDKWRDWATKTGFGSRLG